MSLKFDPKGLFDDWSSLVWVVTTTQWMSQKPGGCFTNVSRAIQNNLGKIYNANNYFYGENFKLKLCMCA